MPYQIKYWLSRDNTDFGKDAGLYRITNHAEPVMRMGRWYPANDGGYQISLHDTDVRLLLGEEFELELGGILELAISKYDLHTALAQKMNSLDSQIFSLTTMLGDSLDMILALVSKPFGESNFGDRIKRLKKAFTNVLANKYTPKEMDALFPKVATELNEKR